MCSLVEIINVWEEPSVFGENSKVIFEIHIIWGLYRPLQWGYLGVNGWIILEWISRRWDVGIWTGLGWPRIESDGGRL